MSNPIVYIILNGSLKMSPGKAAAQAVHSIASLQHIKGLNGFSNLTKRTVIVLEAKDQQQMENFEEYLFQLDIPAMSYIDEGVNEIAPYTETALAVGPIQSDDIETREMLRAFPLYGKKKKFWRKLWRK